MRMVFIAALLASALTSSASAGVVYSGEFSGAHGTLTVDTGLGGLGFAPFGETGVGYAATADVTIWSTVPLAEVALDQLRSFDHFWLSQDGVLDYGIDHVNGDEVVDLLTDSETVRTEHSYTRTVHLPWSTEIPTMVCCEGGDLVPGAEITRWRAGPAYVDLTPVSPVSGGKFWIAINDRSLPSSSVPEPGSWVFMIAGFGLAGAILRRRQSLA